ncbi:MAG: LysR family transcriptional regulator [Rhodobacteraceae bacterium]|nr:LysR family transcriptional regulator [Paracoccaceae bacterium]
MLNATWLETFTTLCETGHFTRAADRLAMTQPGVSQHLRKLESQIGAALIAQDGKTFTLTPAGEAVFALGQDRRRQEAVLRDNVARDDPDRGVVTLGCSGSFAVWVYPRLIARMAKAPELVLRLTAAPQRQIVETTLNLDVDIGVISEKVAHPRLETTRLAREELCLVVPAGFKPESLTLKMLDDLGFIAHPDGYAYADDLLGANFPQDYNGADRLRLRSFVNQIGQIPLPVSQGVGYTILPKSGVDAFAKTQAVEVFSLPQRRYQALWVISRKGRAGFARISAVKKLVEQAARDLH